MKKYFFGGLCTSSTSGKGMSVAIFILMLSVSGFSQSGQSVKDSSLAFKKWEVSLDLKPVFRSDQPFKLFIAKNLTERSAIRFGIMVLYLTNSDAPIVTQSFKDSLLFNQSGAIRGDTLVFISSVYAPQTVLQYNLGLSIGYRKEIFLSKLSMYSSTDFGFNRSYYSNSMGASPNYVTGGSFSTSQKIINTSNNFSLVESLGLRYRFNKHLSFTVESNITLGYSRYKNYTFTRTTDAISATQVGNYFFLNFNHLSGFFLNYHF